MRKHVEVRNVSAAQVEAPRDACMHDGLLEGFCLRLKLGPRDVHEGCMRGCMA